MKKNNFKIVELKLKKNKNTVKRTVLIKNFIINEIIVNEKIVENIVFPIFEIFIS